MAVIIAILCSCHLVAAQTPAAVSSQPSDPAPLSASSDHEARKQKTWSLAAQLGLIGNNRTFMSPASLNIGYFLTPDLLLFLERGSGSGFLDSFSSRITSINVKHFFKSTGTYYRVGLNYSQIEEDSDSFANLFSSNTWSYRANTVSITLNLGFQRNWNDGWVFGFDAIGVNIPISHDYKDETAVDSASLADLKQNQKGRIEEISLNVAWVYLGFAF